MALERNRHKGENDVAKEISLTFFKKKEEEGRKEIAVAWHEESGQTVSPTLRDANNVQNRVRKKK